MYYLVRVLLFCLAPLISMTAGGLLMQLWSPSKLFVAAVQHFAAGIVIAAVSLELLPPTISAGSGTVLDYVSISLGFGIAVGVLLLLEKYTSTEAEDKEDVESPEERSPLSVQVQEDRRIPWGVVLAMAVDASVDGLLIGISIVAGSAAGIVMATAVSIEMCFLGLSFAGSMQVRGVARSKAIALCIVLPIFIPTFALVGASILSRLSGAAYLGVLSFGAGALLYLVADELLVKAHEYKSTHAWWVTIQFYVGFFIALILQKLTEKQ